MQSLYMFGRRREEEGEKEKRRLHKLLQTLLNLNTSLPVNLAGGLVTSPAVGCTTTLSSTNLCEEGEGGKGEGESQIKPLMPGDLI